MLRIGIISLFIALTFNTLLPASKKYNNEVVQKRTRFSKTIKQTGTNFALAVFS